MQYMILLTVVHVYVLMQICSKQIKHTNSTSRLSDILNVISVKLCLIINGLLAVPLYEYWKRDACYF
jgi:hypothetical protein